MGAAILIPKTHITHASQINTKSANRLLRTKSIRIENLLDIKVDAVQSLLTEMEDACSYYAVLLINKGLIEGVLEIFHREPFNLNEDLHEFLVTLAGKQL